MNRQKVGNRLAKVGFGFLIGIGAMMMVVKDNLRADNIVMLGVVVALIAIGLNMGKPKKA